MDNNFYRNLNMVKPPVHFDSQYQNNVPVNTEQVLNFYRDLIKEAQNASYKLDLELLKQEGNKKEYQLKCEYEQYKLFLKEKQAAGMEQRRRNNEMAQTVVQENLEGFPVVVTFFPNGETSQSLPFIMLHRPVAYTYRNVKSIVIVDSSDLAMPIILTGKDVSAKALTNALAKNGYPFTCSMRKRKEYSELFLDYLLSNAQEKRLAEFLGWNNDGTNWFFAEEYYQTIEGMLGGEKNV